MKNYKIKMKRSKQINKQFKFTILEIMNKRYNNKHN